jgi:Putative zinc-finger
MEHTQAIESQAVERYLLGDMEDWEAESFEEHFFECKECAEALEVGNQAIDHVRAAHPAPKHDPVPAPSPVPVLREPRRRAWWEVLWAPAVAAPAFAALLLAGVVGYQATELAGLNQVQAPVSFLLHNVRKGADSNLIKPDGHPLVLRIDLVDDSYASYRCDVYDATRLRFSVTAAAPPHGDELELLIPAGKLKSGDYKLLVRGVRDPADNTGTEVAHNEFKIE